MQEKDRLDLSRKNLLDLIVDQRRILVPVIAVMTVVLALLVPNLKMDWGLQSAMVTTSSSYAQYKTFLEEFGSDEFILVAISSKSGANDPGFLRSLDAISRSIEALDKVSEVISLANLRVFQHKGDRLGVYPVISSAGGSLSLPDPADLARFRQALPMIGLLLSGDLRTAGVLVRVKEEWRFDPDVGARLVDAISKITRDHVEPGTEYRIIGAPLIRMAVVSYNIQTGMMFALMSLLICTVVSLYVFKQASMTLVANIILCVCVLWVLGLMSALDIPLNSTTALSFGFILITTLEIVIHMVVRYHQFYQDSASKTGAIKQAVRWLARPCLVCSATTAVGFGTLMISSIPMVRQLGFIMSFGVMTSYVLAMILTPAFFVTIKSLDLPGDSGMLRDWLGRVLLGLEQSIFKRPRFLVLIGVLATAVLLAGTPMIHTDTQILSMLKGSTKEVQDISFVEERLSPVQSVELMLEGESQDFKKPELWKRVAELEKRLKQIPEVADVDSILPFLEYLNGLVGSDGGKQDGLFSHPALIPQLLAMTRFGTGGERILNRFLNPAQDKLHISVRIRNSSSVPVHDTIQRILSTAKDTMNGASKVSITGELVLVAEQSSAVIADQIWSLFLAGLIITALMMIQLGSPMLGLLCLLPNIAPVAAVFGVMGWLGYTLNSVTVFVATVAIGLAADNTIHYLTQLKREITLHPEQGIEACVSRAYKLTAKQIAAWSVVILFGFLALVFSPFRPVECFGVAGSAAILIGLYGDLLFIQALILSSRTIRKALGRLIEKQMLGNAPSISS
ncbi:MAG: MMPL family transporter [Desulfomonile tiedjei]|nr:MMPL family transporter [Desulfomonile tiedjei]